MDSFRKDIRYGFRMLMKKPLVTAVAVIAFALGIGANTAMFTLIDALLIRPLTFKDLDRLVMVWNGLAQGGNRFGVSPADYDDYKNRSTSFEHLAAYTWADMNITGNGDPERISGFKTTSNFFDTLDMKPSLGRTFLPEDDQPGRDQVAILSNGLWKRRYGSDANIVGKTIELNERSFMVIGVMPEDGEWPMSVEVWTPLVMNAELLKDRQNHMLLIMGRIKPGLAISEAQSEMNVIATHLAEEYPNEDSGRSISLVKLPGQASDDFTSPILMVLMGAVGFVLLIACANVANLQLARATGRQKEVAIRLALGATRWRIVRQLLTESVMLSFAGALMGLLLALWGADLLKSSLPPDQARYIPGLKHMGIDSRALLFTMAVAVLTGLISGLAPSLQASRPNLNETLKEGGRSTSSGSTRHYMRNMLVVSEVALALVLLVGTGLMVRGFSQLVSNQRQGFDPANILTFNITLPELKYKEPHDRMEFYNRVIQRLSAQPEVESAATVSFIPSNGNWSTEGLIVEDRPALAPGENTFVDYQVISPRYFDTMRIPIRGGRDFASSDDDEGTPVAIISESAARQFWPDGSPIGKRIRMDMASNNQWRTIVGIAGDIKTFMFDKEPRPTVYVPYAQYPRHSMGIVVRTAGDPTSFIAAARREVLGIDPNQPVYDINSMERVIANHISGIGLSAALMAIFGVLALVLAAVGVYSVMAYSVTQRTHEIGVRMALGASPGDVLKLVVGQAMKMALIGLVIGLPAAFALSRLMASAFAGIVALDIVTFAGFTLLLVTIALLSGYFPARRAARLDPMAALRCE